MELCRDIGHSYQIRKVVNYSVSDDSFIMLVIITILFSFTVILIPVLPIVYFFLARKVTSYELCDRCGHKI